MKRQGKKLRELADGHPRRMSDGRNAWRKMDPNQQEDFLHWIALSAEDGTVPMPEGWTISKAGA